MLQPQCQRGKVFEGGAIGKEDTCSGQVAVAIFLNRTTHIKLIVTSPTQTRRGPGMRRTNLTIVIARLKTKIIDVDVIVEIFDPQALSNALSKRVLEVNKAAIACVDAVEIGSENLTVHF